MGHDAKQLFEKGSLFFFVSEKLETDYGKTAMWKSAGFYMNEVTSDTAAGSVDRLKCLTVGYTTDLRLGQYG